MTIIRDKRIKSIHFVGIKGVGMAPLAIIAKEAGFSVTGSDIDSTFITDKVLEKAKIKAKTSFAKDNIGKVNLVIFSGAHGGLNNVEVAYAKEKGVRIMTQGEAVGEFMKGDILNKKFVGISVAGCHGKTTTTGIIATIFEESGLFPSYLIGTGEGHFGKGNYFIAEADEYATEPVFDKTPKFLWQHPKIAIFTNIDFDHPDMYQDIEDTKRVFLAFAKNLETQSGLLIANGDDRNIRDVLKAYGGRLITYGFSPVNDYVIKKVNISGSQTFFWLDAKDVSLGEFTIKVPGEHNAENAAAAIICALESGIPLEKVKKSLASFLGTKRRFEYIGKIGSTLVYDDYAHHPTEIRKTLKAFHEVFPKSQIVCIFQPHTYSRTKKMFDQFLDSFSYANTVVITNIYGSERENKDDSVSGEMLAKKLSITHPKVIFLPEGSDVVKYINLHPFDRNTILVSMGAGDIYKIWDQLNVNPHEK
ncbi:MAG: UDP-N-acetylmuramate--L-alanine ligase [Patescibacteria group bacterium]|nr:UDP-N-acetylmuramate--L-alanine ligase [Patescibacteria group bacterium]